MTLFIVLAIVMAAVAIGFIVRPLLRKPGDVPQHARSQPAKVAAVATAVALPLLAAWLYSTVSTQQWDYEPAAAGAEAGAAAPDVERMVAQLEERLQAEPGDAEGWLMLGRSFVVLGRYPRAVDAFQQAYDLTQGDSLPAITGLAEALILTDEASLNGRAGELIESALVRAPREPRALWYGSLAALSAGKLEVARDRMQLLLEQNPPEQVRLVLQTQIADIDAQLGALPPATAAPAANGAAVNVAVSIAPALAARITSPLSLFVLARNAAGGPPLAVVRLTSDQLPATVQLTDANAMIAGQGLGSVRTVQIVARVSQTGNAQAAAGDFYGETDYVVQPGPGSVNILIDRVVP